MPLKSGIERFGQTVFPLNPIGKYKVCLLKDPDKSSSYLEHKNSKHGSKLDGNRNFRKNSLFFQLNRTDDSEPIDLLHSIEKMEHRFYRAGNRKD